MKQEIKNSVIRSAGCSQLFAQDSQFMLHLASMHMQWLYNVLNICACVQLCVCMCVCVVGEGLPL